MSVPSEPPGSSPLAPSPTWRERVRTLKREVKALALACRDPRTPRPVKLLGLAVVAYAVSPIDLIPDAIPVLGYLDDLVLLPLGLLLVRRLLPPEVLADAREAAAADPSWLPKSRGAAAVIFCLWLLAIAGVGWLTIGLFHRFHHA